MSKAKRSGRVWYPILSTSANPAVVTNSVGSPCRSSRAFATVVLFDRVNLVKGYGLVVVEIKEISDALYCRAGVVAGLSDSNLWVTNVPSGVRPTMSVKVLPVDPEVPAVSHKFGIFVRCGR